LAISLPALAKHLASEIGSGHAAQADGGPDARGQSRAESTGALDGVSALHLRPGMSVHFSKLVTEAKVAKTVRRVVVENCKFVV